MKTVHSIYLLLFFVITVSCKNELKENTEAEILQEDVTNTATDIPYFENNEVFWGNTHLHTALSADGLAQDWVQKMH